MPSKYGFETDAERQAKLAQAQATQMQAEQIRRAQEMAERNRIQAVLRATAARIDAVVVDILSDYYQTMSSHKPGEIQRDPNGCAWHLKGEGVGTVLVCVQMNGQNKPFLEVFSSGTATAQIGSLIHTLWKYTGVETQEHYEERGEFDGINGSDFM
jgi:hypothetical protein